MSRRSSPGSWLVLPVPPRPSRSRSSRAAPPTQRPSPLEGLAASTDHLLDGGVLNNLPLDRAIAAMFAMEADSRPERLLVAVVPDPAKPKDPNEVADAPPPSVGDIVTASLMGVPHNQTVRAFVDDVPTHNATVDGRGVARRSLLDRPANELQAAAGTLVPSYKAARRTALARELAGRIGAPGYAAVLKEFPTDLPHCPVTWPAGEAGWEASVLLRHVALLLLLGQPDRGCCRTSTRQPTRRQSATSPPPARPAARPATP